MSLKYPKIPPIDSHGHQMEVYQDLNAPDKHGTSTSYMLTTTNTKHILPTQTSLQPNQDTKSGDVETWPAYASRGVSDTGLIGSSFNKQLVAVKKSVIPKPRFLSALEAYVQKEVVQLDCLDSHPNELRLQAYREVFEYLIEDFKTYKPLLSQIKDEYEKMLSYYRQQIRELEPLKAMLITVSEQCDQKILGIREEERQDIMVLRKNKMDLLKYIDSMRERETALHAQVTKLQEELSVEYKRYRNECDMRKLLISDMNDLRHQQEDLKRAAGQGVIDADDDPIRLKLSLKVAKEDLSRQANELLRMQADYGDVIPRRDFLSLETKYTELEEKNGQLLSDFQNLKEEHSTLLEVHKQVLDQRDEFYTEAETLRRSATPRPHWSKFGDVISAGPDHWHDVSSGKRSAEILETLLSELKAGGAQGPATFDGKGTGEDIPKFLRFEGNVLNRQLKKSDLSALLKDVWARKVQSDANRGSREKMSDFLHAFFMERYSNQENMTAEWCYSMHEALNNYSDEPHFKLFLNVVNDEVPEDLYYHQMDVINNLMVELRKVDTENTGHITQGQFSTAVATAFPLKTDANKEALAARALEELEATPDNMEFNALFTEDEDGHTGPFLNLLKTQEEDEIETYMTDIKKQLEGVTQVALNDLRSTLMMVDPVIDQAQTMKYLQIAFKCETSDLDNAEPVDIETILERMRKGGVHRRGAAF